MTFAPMPDRGLIKSPPSHGASGQPVREERHTDQHRQPEPGRQSRQFPHAVYPQMVRSLKGWLSGLKEKKAALLEALEQAKERPSPNCFPGIWICGAKNAPAGLPKGKLKGTVGDFNKVMEAWTSCGRKRFPPWRALTPIWMKPAHRPFPSVRKSGRWRNV